MNTFQHKKSIEKSCESTWGCVDARSLSRRIKIPCFFGVTLKKKFHWMSLPILSLSCCFFVLTASYKFGRSILPGKRATHWEQRILPFLLREVCSGRLEFSWGKLANSNGCGWEACFWRTLCQGKYGFLGKVGSFFSIYPPYQFTSVMLFHWGVLTHY